MRRELGLQMDDSSKLVPNIALVPSMLKSKEQDSSAAVSVVMANNAMYMLKRQTQTLGSACQGTIWHHRLRCRYFNVNNA